MPRESIKEEVLDFIKRRFPYDVDWNRGNCYWFALILRERFFSNFDIFYQAKKGHFVAGDGSEFFDYFGTVDDIIEDPPIHFNRILLEDPVWAERLIRDCVK